MTADTVIVLDYSGTLSTGAVAFGQPSRLQAALDQTGLAAVGIDTPQVYWQRIMIPTWHAASTATRPFARYIVDQVMGMAPAQSADAVAGAASRFVAAYLAASGIAAPWRQLVRRLCRRSDVRLIVATDHYAEATDAIVGHLAAMGAKSAPLAAAAAGDIWVANSADLGCHKIDPSYWRQVVQALGRKAATVLLVDDFGAGEPGASGTAAPEAVGRRKRRTTEALQAAGDWSVHVHAFAPAVGAAAAVEAVWGHIRGIVNDR